MLLELVERIEQATGLDGLAEPVSKVVGLITSPTPVKNLLSGTWLEHRVHPMLVTVPIGAWSGAAVLDLLPGDERARFGADAMIAVGAAAALPTAATGLNDWVDTYGGAKRVGLVHATANSVALTCYVASLVARAAGRRSAGRLLAWAGYCSVLTGGYLGGHLSYVQGVGVDRRAFMPLPEDWTPAAPEADVVEGEPRTVEALNGLQVLLYRDGGRLYAMAATCVHEGGPLGEGTFADGCVTCPWHGSTFRLGDGKVVRAPAAAPQPTLDTRVRDGMIEVRLAR
jgi:nitrite reductase/ring-hydroxylating ferredoxin subunit